MLLGLGPWLALQPPATAALFILLLQHPCGKCRCRLGFEMSKSADHLHATSPVLFLGDLWSGAGRNSPPHEGLLPTPPSMVPPDPSSVRHRTSEERVGYPDPPASALGLIPGLMTDLGYPLHMGQGPGQALGRDPHRLAEQTEAFLQTKRHSCCQTWHRVHSLQQGRPPRPADSCLKTEAPVATRDQEKARGMALGTVPGLAPEMVLGTLAGKPLGMPPGVA